MSIASLKGVLNQHKIESKCFDLNIELYHSVSFSEWIELDNYFQTDLRYTGLSEKGAGTRDIHFAQIMAKRRLGSSTASKYDDFIRTKVEEINNKGFDWVGLSIFSVNSVVPGVDFLIALKKYAPNLKVMVGGMGLSSFGLGGEPNFGNFLLKSNLVDTVVVGEGENSIIEVLKEKTKLKISEQIDNLDSIAFPDYTDFDFSLYPGKENMIYLTGSRGCVRRCTFCDIGSLWKKFRYRSGASLAKEIYEGYHRYGTIDFYFTDSLINGNLNEFKVLLDEIIRYKKNGDLPEEVMFGGQWICRPKERFGEEQYAKMARAGVYNISVGVESGSDKVLKDMRKGTTRSDHDFMMEMADKYGIRLNMLMLFGYPTETEEDFEMTLQMLRDYKKYSDSGVIWGVVLGKTMVVLPNTPISESASHWGLTYDDNGNWLSKNNPSLTYHERVRRRIVAGKLCERLGFVIKSQVVTVNSLYEIVKEGGYDSLA